MAHYMPEPCKFPSLSSCHKRFLWVHKEVHLVLHLVVGLVLQVGDAKKFPQALGHKSLGPGSKSADRLPELPPFVVVVVGISLSRKDRPSPLVYEVTEWQEGNLHQGHLQQEVDLVHCTQGT